ncbi:MAG: hypothetical protein MUF63_10215 [Rhodobacteraceae bacterium]|nr:hypothetical protein [Paracoccaceae bacterium]
MPSDTYLTVTGPLWRKKRRFRDVGTSTWIKPHGSAAPMLISIPAPEARLHRPEVHA